jgi:hypothetical protein
VGATVFMAGGVAASRLEHTPDVLAYAYAAIVFFALRRLLAAPSLKRGCLLGLAAGVMATHLVQIAYLFALVFALYAIVSASARWLTYTPEERIRSLGGMALAIVIAVAIAIPQLLFSAAFMATSNRAGLPLDAAQISSLDLRAFLIMFVPNVFHTFQGAYDSYTGPVNFVESYLYIGVIPLLSLAFIARAWKQPAYRWALVFCATVGVAATLYMMGTNTPVYRWLYTWLPGLTHFRRPDDAAYVVNFVFAIAAGLCASQLNLQSRRELTVFFGFAIAWLAIIAVQMHDRHARTFAAVVAAVAALWQLRKKHDDWRVAIWVLLVLVVDYRCYNLNGRFNEMENTSERLTHGKAIHFLEQQLTGNDGLPYRFTTRNTELAWDNVTELTGLASTQGYNPVRLALYEQIYKPHESSNSAPADNPLNSSPSYTLDRLLGARFIVVGHRKELPAYTPPASYVHVFSDDDVDIWRNDSTYPRVLNPSRLIVSPLQIPIDPAAFARTDFNSTAWLMPRSTAEAVKAHTIAATCTGQVTTKSANASLISTTLRVDAQARGLIVLGDIDAPGWRAYVDGAATPIYRANGMFRAICIPPGQHTVLFAFSPLNMIADAFARHSRT